MLNNPDSQKSTLNLSVRGQKIYLERRFIHTGNLNLTSRWRVSATEAFIQWIQKRLRLHTASLSPEPAALSAAGQSLILTRLGNIRNSTKLLQGYTGSKRQRLIWSHSFHFHGCVWQQDQRAKPKSSDSNWGPKMIITNIKGRQVNNIVLLEFLWSVLLPMEFTHKKRLWGLHSDTLL